MPITVTITADNFQELFTMLRDVPVTRTTEPVTRTTEPVTRTTEHIEDVPAIAPVETDVEGAEWNAELHASSKAKTKDGKWRKKRGVDSEETPEPVAMPHTVAPVTEPVAMPHTVAPPSNAPTYADIVAPPSNAPTYADIVALCSEKYKTGAVNAAVLGTLQMEFGIENMTMLIGKPDLIPAFYARVQAL
jgi:hypothetical protein